VSQPLAGVPGGIGLGVEEYAEFLGREYLASFVRLGGATVRVVAPGDDAVSKRWHAALADATKTSGYQLVALDAADVRIHLLQEVTLAATRTIDWRATAVAVVRGCYEREGLPAHDSVLVQRVATEHDVDARELGRTMRRALEYDVLGDSRLSMDFRRAMLRLCQAELTGGIAAGDERTDVLGWLHGEKVPLARLRGLLIGSRIDRSTARGVLLSLPVWLAKAGQVGLVLDLDLHRLAVSRRPPAPKRDGQYYSRTAILDAYEVLRQLIDATDDMYHCLVVATLPPALVADEGRGLPAYSALHLRVADEVHDRRRANPFAALVRLEARLEVVA
jgi:hypothetical protein